MYDVFVNKLTKIRNWIRDNGGIINAIKSLFTGNKAKGGSKATDKEWGFSETAETLNATNEEETRDGKVDELLNIKEANLSNQQRFEVATAILIKLNAMMRSGKKLSMGKPHCTVSDNERQSLMVLASRLLQSLKFDNGAIEMTAMLQKWAMPIRGDLMNVGDHFTGDEIATIQAYYSEDNVNALFSA